MFHYTNTFKATAHVAHKVIIHMKEQRNVVKIKLNVASAEERQFKVSICSAILNSNLLKKHQSERY